MISSLQFVSFSIPSLVTTQEFSMPTGLHLNNDFSVRGQRPCPVLIVFMRGANTGASLISSPIPWPINLACCPVPINLSANPASLAISTAMSKHFTSNARFGDGVGLVWYPNKPDGRCKFFQAALLRIRGSYRSCSRWSYLQVQFITALTFL